MHHDEEETRDEELFEEKLEELGGTRRSRSQESNTAFSSYSYAIAPHLQMDVVSDRGY